MKLYFSPGACSLSPHIVSRELGLDIELEKVNFSDKKTDKGQDFNAVNPKSYVPTLQLDNGEVLTEGPAIVQYLADQKPEKGLAPAAGTFERYRLQEWLNFISTELHKGFSPLFNSKMPDEGKAIARERLSTRFAYVDGRLKDQQFLLGDQFSVADAYLFTVLNWANYVKLDLSGWPSLVAYHQRVGARPAVQAALVAEGLIKAA